MHSFNVLVHKVLPMQPDIVVLHHNINDLSILISEGTYWNNHPTRSLVVGQRSVWDEERQFVGRRLIPNLRNWIEKIRADLFGGGDITRPPSGGSPLPEREPLEAEFALALDLFIDVARRRGIIPVLMTQATLSDGSPDAEVTRFNDYLVPRTNVCTILPPAGRPLREEAADVLVPGKWRGNRLSLSRRPPARAPLVVGGLLGGSQFDRKVLKRRDL